LLELLLSPLSLTETPAADMTWPNFPEPTQVVVESEEVETMQPVVFGKEV
jgi:hypothetical protein